VPVGTVTDSLPLKPIDRILQSWRIAKVQPYITRGARVLDIGCADGALFRQLAAQISSGVGVDPALEQSVGDGRFHLIAGPLTHALGSAGEFDVITMLAVVEHLPEEVVPEMREQCVRLLKPGGLLLITVPSAQVDRLLDWLTRLHLIAGMSLHEHHGFDPAEVPRWFGCPELILLRTRRFQLGLNNLFVFRKHAIQ
jgi:2-polyprenyl-3-methyl-5-hydroxy-6-metoxy-1,4-benzoquinol methylase